MWSTKKHFHTLGYCNIYYRDLTKELFNTELTFHTGTPKFVGYMKLWQVVHSGKEGRQMGI